MARVSVFYDKDIKEQVFMVRGDERYTHSTKTIIELGSTGSQDVYGFVQEIHVNVLRDYGNSSIIIYDNDVALTVIDDWTSVDTGRTISLPPITWDTAHNIKAKYIGNGKCSPSMSNTLTIDALPNPHKTDADLITTVYYPELSDLSTFQIKSSFDMLDRSETIGLPIKFYLDGDYVDTVNIANHDGTIESVIEFTDVPDGLHTVKAEFEGTVELYAKTTTNTVSVGQKLTILSHPNLFVTGDTASFSVKLTDYFDTPIEGYSLSAGYYISDVRHYFAGGSSDSDGLLTLSGTVPADIGDGTFDFQNFQQDVLGSIKLPQFTPTTLTMTPTTDRLYKNQNTVFSINVKQNIEGVPVTFKEIASDNTVISTEVADTNSIGVATFTVRGKGEQNRIFKAEVGAVTITDWFEDYSQYWEANNIVNREYTLPAGGQLLDLASSFQIYSPTGQDVWLFLNPTRNKDYGIYLENVYSTNSKGVAQDIHFHVYGTSNDYKLNANRSNIWIYRNASGVVDVMDSSGNSYRIANQGTNPTILIFHQKTTFSKLTVRESDHDELIEQE